MSAIEQLKQAWRDFATDGVASSGFHEPDKAAIRAGLTLLATELSSIGAGILRYANKATMDADTAQEDGQLAYVFGDATAANNTFYQWNGSGPGWETADWYYDAFATALGVIINAAANTHFIGGSGNAAATGSRNVGAGYEALFSITTGGDNVAGGYRAGYGLTDSSFNTAMGSKALFAGGGGSCVAIGFETFQATTGAANIGLGFRAGFSGTTGAYNVAIGHSAMIFSTTASYNTAIGDGAGAFFNGANATLVGSQANYNGASADNLVAVGRRAAYEKPSGGDCTFVGASAGYAGFAGEVGTGEGNTGIGTFSLGHLTTGQWNTACGRASGWFHATASQNCSLGMRAGYGNVGGNNNLALGFYAGRQMTNPSRSCMIGSQTDFFYPATPALTATPGGGGSMAAGTYSYRVTMVVDGVESAISEPVGATVGASGSVSFTGIPLYSGPRNCTARRIYRTMVDGENIIGLVVELADNTTTTYTDTKADAALGAQPSAAGGFIALGYFALAMKPNQMVVGSALESITEVVIGNGVDSTGPQAVTMQSSNASGADVTGADYRIAGGRGTGSAKGGRVIIATAPAGSSGTTGNALEDWLAATPDKALEITETTSAAVTNPPAGTLSLFAEGGALKFKTPAGTVLTITTA